jgi:phosphoribosylformylglycinamidine (FGAM) synthase-like enzyme
MQDHEKMATIGFKAEGDAIFLVGQNNGHLGQSLWLRELHGREDGAPPPINLVQERTHGEFVRKLIEDGKVNAVHDVSDGGLLVAIAEMALAGGIGCTIEQIGDHFTAFGEDQTRYLVTGAVADTIQEAGIPMTRIGTTGGESINMHGKSIPLTALREASDSFFRDWMKS